MPTIELPLVGPSEKAGQPAHAAGRTVNLYPEKIGDAWALKHVPGSFRRVDFTLSDTITVPDDAPIRGMHMMGSRFFVAVHNYILEATPPTPTTEIDDTTFTVRTTLSTFSGPVGFSDNAGKLVIGDGRYWTFDFDTGVLSPVLNSGLEQLLGYWPEWIDGTTLYPIRQTSDYQYSAVDDATTVRGLWKFAAEGNPDNILRMHVINGQIFILGTNSTENHYDNGDANNPFQRISGGLDDHGCVGQRASCKFDNTVVMVGGNSAGAGRVFRLGGAGSAPQVISTPAVEKAIEKVLFAQGNLARQITMYPYDDQGHSFFILNLPAVDATINNPAQPSMTWAFDAATNLWHERAFNNPATGRFERHVGDCHVYYRGRHYLGAYNAPHIYEMSRDYFRENTVPIVKWREFGPFDINGTLNSLEFKGQQGVGRDGGVFGSDPQLMYRICWDGKWQPVEIWRAWGKIGETDCRTKSGPHGSGRQLTIEVSCADPIPFTLTKCVAEIPR